MDKFEGFTGALHILVLISGAGVLLATVTQGFGWVLIQFGLASWAPDSWRPGYYSSCAR